MSLKKKLSNQILLKQKYIKKILNKREILLTVKITHFAITLLRKKKKTYSSYKLYVVPFKSHCPNEIKSYDESKREQRR